MLLALKRFAKLALIPVLISAGLPANSKSQVQRLVVNAPSPSSPLPASLDPAADALLALGPDGEAIWQARAEVLAMLSEPNSCPAWFQTAEPQVFEKFRSLEFAVDSTGSAEILKLAAWREGDGYYQPYVASTGQNVGWGSTVTLNENGAFFKKMAPVRVVTGFDDKGYFRPSRSLMIGTYEGGTLPARILALLHELGHVVNLLPIDYAVPSAPAISVQNTEKVLRHCGAQIHAHRKPSRATNSAPTLTASAPVLQDSFAVKPKARGASLR